MILLNKFFDVSAYIHLFLTHLTKIFPPLLITAKQPYIFLSIIIRITGQVLHA